MELRTASDIISILVDQYHHEAAMAINYEKDHDVAMAFIFRRNGIYDALMAIADYNENIVIDWINA